MRQGFMFASLDPMAAFEKFVSDVATRFREDNYEPEASRLTSTREYEIDAHWALYCENYLEGFHIPYVHHSLNEIVDYGSYATETFRYSSLQTAAAAAGGTPAVQSVAAKYLFLFPNTMFNFYPWGISVNVVRPVSPSKTVVEFLTYVSDDSLVETGAGTDLHRVEMEDEAVVGSNPRDE